MTDWFKLFRYFHCQFIIHQQLNLWIDTLSWFMHNHTVCGRNGSSISNATRGLSHKDKEEGGIWIWSGGAEVMFGSSFLSAVHSREAAQLRVPSLSWHWRYYTESDSWHISKCFKLELHFQIFLFVRIKSELKPETGWNSDFVMVSNKMKAWTSQEDTNHLVVRLLWLC